MLIFLFYIFFTSVKFAFFRHFDLCNNENVERCINCISN